MIKITNMFIKKIYQLLQSKIGLVIVIASYFILGFPLTTSVDAIQYAIGGLIGSLLSPLVIILVLKRFYNWTLNQKILHIFFLAFLFRVMLSQKFLVPVLNFISLVALIILIILFVLEIFKRKK